MSPRDIALKFEKLRAELAAYRVPSFYASRVEPLRRMLNDTLVLMRELAWHVDKLSSTANKDKPESNP